LAKFTKKRNNNWKTWKSSEFFGGFQWPEMRGKNCKNYHISIFGLVCVRIFFIKKRIKICTSYLVYSHIWLYLPKENHHFFKHLPKEDHHLNYK
jgi:hypothetical protein